MLPKNEAWESVSGKKNKVGSYNLFKSSSSIESHLQLKIVFHQWLSSFESPKLSSIKGPLPSMAAFYQRSSTINSPQSKLIFN